MNNLVLCTGWRYDVSEITVFVESWKKYMSNYSSMIMVIEPYASAEKLKYLKQSQINVKFFTAADFIPSVINNTRYFKYLDILLEDCHYDRIFLCDVADVAFQGNIFEEIMPNNYDGIDLFVNKEDHRHNLTESYNRKWLINNYGLDIADMLSHKHILCSGTTLGNKERIVAYILELIAQRNLDHMIRAGGRPDEQAIYNYIFHNNLIQHTQLQNGIGVATLALCPSEDIQIDTVEDKVIVYNKIPSVIHQWNRIDQRSPYLARYYGQKYK